MRDINILTGAIEYLEVRGEFGLCLVGVLNRYSDVVAAALREKLAEVESEFDALGCQCDIPDEGDDDNDNTEPEPEPNPEPLPPTDETIQIP